MLQSLLITEPTNSPMIQWYIKQFQHHTMTKSQFILQQWDYRPQLTSLYSRTYPPAWSPNGQNFQLMTNDRKIATFGDINHMACKMSLQYQSDGVKPTIPKLTIKSLFNMIFHHGVKPCVDGLRWWVDYFFRNGLVKADNIDDYGSIATLDGLLHQIYPEIHEIQHGNVTQYEKNNSSTISDQFLGQINSTFQTEDSLTFESILAIFPYYRSNTLGYNCITWFN